MPEAQTNGNKKNGNGGNKGGNKTTCPISLTEFKAGAKDLTIIINERPVAGVVKEFSSGSFGWYSNDKVPVKIGDKTVMAQVGLNLIVVGSKDAAR